MLHGDIYLAPWFSYVSSKYFTSIYTWLERPCTKLSQTNIKKSHNFIKIDGKLKLKKCCQLTFFLKSISKYSILTYLKLKFTIFQALVWNITWTRPEIASEIENTFGQNGYLFHFCTKSLVFFSVEGKDPKITLAHVKS